MGSESLCYLPTHPNKKKKTTNKQYPPRPLNTYSRSSPSKRNPWPPQNSPGLFVCAVKWKWKLSVHDEPKKPPVRTPYSVHRAHILRYRRKKNKNKRNEKKKKKKTVPRRKACNNIEPVWAIVQKCLKSTKAEISFAPAVFRAPASFVFFYFYFSYFFFSLFFFAGSRARQHFC